MKSDIFNLIRENGDEKDRIGKTKYFRNLFCFIGIKKPLIENLIKPFLKSEEKIDWDFINECWKQKEREFKHVAIYYLNKNLTHIKSSDLIKIKKLVEVDSWWDSIDCFSKVFNSSLLNDHEKSKKIFLKWSTDKNFWVRRCSIISQLIMKEKTDVFLLEKCLVNNLNQKEFFINKAIGWALRDYGKTNPKWVKEFVKKNKKNMAPLSIKEATRLLN